MNVLIVVASCFGNTAKVADAVAAGLRSRGAAVTVVDAASAPAPVGFDLVCVGAPTHNLGLPTPRSRAAAVERGGRAPASGVAEWLDAQGNLPGIRVAAFDTVVRGAFSGSAAKRIVQRLRRLRADVAGRESFVVAGSPVALADGELARARAWGVALASWGRRWTPTVLGPRRPVRGVPTPEGRGRP